jgi:hypothetical protein
MFVRNNEVKGLLSYTNPFIVSKKGSQAGRKDIKVASTRVY